MATVLVEVLFFRRRYVSMMISWRKLLTRVQKANAGSLSKPVEAGAKNSNTKVESIVSLGMEWRPVETRKLPKSMLANSVTS